MIRCRLCKELKEETDFYKNSTAKSGVQSDCKPCQAKTNLARYHSKLSGNKELKVKKAEYDNYDREGVICMYNLAQKLSKITGVEMHVDHIKPLSKGGEHDTKNLQLLAGVLNVAKGASEDFQLNLEKYPK